MNNQQTAKEKFLETTLSQISQYYSGKRNCCRCGCGGKYTSTSFASKARSEVNDKKVQMALNRAKKFVRNGANYDHDSNYFDVETAPNRTLTFYFDEVKGGNNE